jgi:hypothetical protein
MRVLSGFPRSRLPDYDNNLMFSVLSGKLATLWPWFMGSVAHYKQRAAQNSPVYRIHPSAHILATFFEPRVFCNIEENAASE